MSAANVRKTGGGGVPSAALPRRPAKIKPGATGTVHLSFVVEADLVRAVDEEMERMSESFGVAVSRTDTVRTLIRDGLKYRADKRGK